MKIELSHETVDEILVSELKEIYEGYYESWDDPAQKAELVLAAKTLLMFHMSNDDCIDYFGHGWQ